MRPRADGQRQGQIKEPEATSAPLRMMNLEALAAQRSVRVQGAEGNGFGKADALTTGMRSGSVLTRCRWWRPRAGELGQIRRSLAWFRTLQEGYMEE